MDKELLFVLFISGCFNYKKSALHLAVEMCPHNMTSKWTHGRAKVSINGEIEMWDVKNLKLLSSWKPITSSAEHFTISKNIAKKRYRG